MASQPGDRSLIASFPSIAFCLLNERPGLRLKHRPIPRENHPIFDLSPGPTSPVILLNLWTVLRPRLNQPFFFFFFRSSARFSFLDLSAASEACSSSLSLRSASSQWSSSWPFGRPCFSQSWWARSWTREVSSKARPFHRDDFRASPVTRERGFATTAALNVYTSVGPVRPTGGLSRCVAELHAYIDAAGIAEDRKGWLCGYSNGQLVIGEAEKRTCLRRKGFRARSTVGRWVPAHRDARAQALKSGFRCRSSQITSILRCVSASRRRLDRTR